jgi:hypothetical protein
MSDRLDERIKELYAELTDAAPDLPPLPAPGRTRSPMWSRPVAIAAAGVAALVVVVGVGAALLTQLDPSDSDDSAAAPPPAVIDAPEPPGESAATVVGAPEAPDGAEEQRPTDTILLLADLNQACTTAQAVLAADLPASPSTRGDFIMAFDLVANQIGPIRQVATAAEGSSDPTLAAISAQSLAVLQILEQGPGDDQAVSTGRLTAALIETRTLGLLLEGFGALDCAGLGNLP